MTRFPDPRRASRASLLSLAATALLAVTPVSAQTVVTLPPIQDAHVRDLLPASNFGALPEIWFGRGSSFGLGLVRTLVEFDLGALPGPNVKHATFSAWQFATEPAAGTIDCQVHRCTTAWTELGATWDAQPSFDAKSWAEAGVGSGPFGWVDWDVTALVRDQAAGVLPSLGWLFKVPFETSGISRLGYFHSREFSDAALRPKLVVELYDLDLAVAQPVPGVPTPIEVDRANPNEAVALAIDFTQLGLTPVVRLGVVLELHFPSLLALAFADAQGEVATSVLLPPAVSGAPFWIQAAAVGKLSNVVALTMP